MEVLSLGTAVCVLESSYGCLCAESSYGCFCAESNTAVSDESSYGCLCGARLSSHIQVSYDKSGH
jgi:hypothetical protein